MLTKKVQANSCQWEKKDDEGKYMDANGNR